MTPIQRPALSVVLPFFLFFLLTRDACCFTLVTLEVDMHYSHIEECCNSLRPKIPCCHIQSCIKASYRASEFESIIVKRVVVVVWLCASLTNEQGNVGSETSSCLCTTTLLFCMTDSIFLTTNTLAWQVRQGYSILYLKCRVSKLLFIQS